MNNKTKLKDILYYQDYQFITIYKNGDWSLEFDSNMYNSNVLLTIDKNVMEKKTRIKIDVMVNKIEYALLNNKSGKELFDNLNNESEEWV